MSHDPKKILQQAKEAIEEHNLISIEEVVSYLPCAKSTFYHFFPSGSDELNSIKSVIGAKKVNIKVQLRRKFLNEGNPAERVALYKLCASDEERRALSMQEVKVTPGSNDEPDFDLGLLSKDERQEWYKLYDKACAANSQAELPEPEKN